MAADMAPLPPAGATLAGCHRPRVATHSPVRAASPAAAIEGKSMKASSSHSPAVALRRRLHAAAARSSPANWEMTSRFTSSRSRRMPEAMPSRCSARWPAQVNTQTRCLTPGKWPIRNAGGMIGRATPQSCHVHRIRPSRAAASGCPAPPAAGRRFDRASLRGQLHRRRRWRRASATAIAGGPPNMRTWRGTISSRRTGDCPRSWQSP